MTDPSITPNTADTTFTNIVTLPGTVEQAMPNVKGFDADVQLTPHHAASFFDRGYRFCVRYVGRRHMNPTRDLTHQEARTILDAGLALMIVQHVEAPGWHPTRALGTEYGANAARFTRELGVPKGVAVWCDLECVHPDTTAADAIGFCNAWFDEVHAAGYEPGLYVGDEPGLTATQLFKNLKFRRYWGAYNVNADQEPITRGWQLKQRVGTGGTIAGISTEQYDDDSTRTDKLGDNVVWLAAPFVG